MHSVIPVLFFKYTHIYMRKILEGYTPNVDCSLFSSLSFSALKFKKISLL